MAGAVCVQNFQGQHPGHQTTVGVTYCGMRRQGLQSTEESLCYTCNGYLDLASETSRSEAASSGVAPVTEANFSTTHWPVTPGGYDTDTS